MSDMGYDEALTYLGEVFTTLCTTEDAKEGVSAFKDKRQPQWKERYPLISSDWPWIGQQGWGRDYILWHLIGILTARMPLY